MTASTRNARCERAFLGVQLQAGSRRSPRSSVRPVADGGGLPDCHTTWRTFAFHPDPDNRRGYGCYVRGYDRHIRRAGGGAEECHSHGRGGCAAGRATEELRVEVVPEGADDAARRRPDQRCVGGEGLADGRVGRVDRPGWEGDEHESVPAARHRRARELVWGASLRPGAQRVGDRCVRLLGHDWLRRWRLVQPLGSVWVLAAGVRGCCPVSGVPVAGAYVGVFAGWVLRVCWLGGTGCVADVDVRVWPGVTVEARGRCAALNGGSW